MCKGMTLPSKSYPPLFVRRPPCDTKRNPTATENDQIELTCVWPEGTKWFQSNELALTPSNLSGCLNHKQEFCIWQISIYTLAFDCTEQKLQFLLSSPFSSLDLGSYGVGCIPPLTLAQQKQRTPSLGSEQSQGW